ncbi:MAG: universal stress protein [Acidobacteria bacterium]|nr:universal stress protein [Acidobacteriota bacterium]
MIRSILFALAETPYGAGASNHACWLARKENGFVHALAVIDIAAFEIPVMGAADGFMPSVVTPPAQSGQTLMQDLAAVAGVRLEEFAARCSARGISCATEIRSGIPADVICQAAAAHDIVVVSRTGYSRVPSPHAVDSLVAPVIRGAVRPVLVAGSEFPEDGELRNVLVAYDGSLHAARALPVAAELAARPGVRCTLLTVAQQESAGRETLAPAAAFLRHHGIDPGVRVIVHAKPSEVICDLAGSEGVDLVVMGAYGRSPIREVLFGSTTERILSHCAASVVLQA